MAEQVRKKAFTFGSCEYESMSPANVSTDTKVLNVMLPFEEALKLHLALLAGVHELNSLNRSTRKGRKAGLNLTVYLDKKRVAVNSQRIR